MLFIFMTRFLHEYFLHALPVEISLENHKSLSLSGSIKRVLVGWRQIVKLLAGIWLGFQLSNFQSKCSGKIKSHLHFVDTSLIYLASTGEIQTHLVSTSKKERHLHLKKLFHCLSHCDIAFVKEMRRMYIANVLATWLILPVVICLSQRLSHACISTYLHIVKPRMAH